MMKASKDMINIRQANDYWLLKDWGKLVQFDFKFLQKHPHRGEFILLVGSAYQQLGNINKGKKYICLALEWGCSREKVAKILITAVFNILDTITILRKNNKKVNKIEILPQAFNLVKKSTTAYKFKYKLNKACQNTINLFIFEMEFLERKNSNYQKLTENKNTISFRKYSNFSSSFYWNERYANGKTSGFGSYGRLAKFKAEIINRFIEEKDIKKIIEFGSGDGNQLTKFNIKNYIGVDVSPFIINKCIKKFKDDASKKFLLNDEFILNPSKAELTISLDVIFHLTDTDIFERYIYMILRYSKRYCIIYSCNEGENKNDAIHIRRRNFTNWIKVNFPEWCLTKVIPNKYSHDGSRNSKITSFSNFYIYEKKQCYE